MRNSFLRKGSILSERASCEKKLLVKGEHPVKREHLVIGEHPVKVEHLVKREHLVKVSIL